MTGIPIAEESRFVGQTTGEVTELVRAGVMEEVPGRRGCQVPVRSPVAWMPDVGCIPDSPL